MASWARWAVARIAGMMSVGLEGYGYGREIGATAAVGAAMSHPIVWGHRDYEKSECVVSV